MPFTGLKQLKERSVLTNLQICYQGRDNEQSLLTAESAQRGA